MFAQTLERVEASEHLDDPEAFAADLPGNLRDIRLLNRWFGGTKLMLRAVEDVTRDLPAFSLLDVATGSADIPLALHERFDGKKELALTALDSSPQILSIARSFVGDAPITLVPGDACHLPFADSSFDVVTCSLALHHFPPSSARQALGEMYRVSRRKVLVADLVRSRAAYACIWALSRAITRNRLTRHDAPLSVLRSYTTSEMLGLAKDADIEHFQVKTVRLFRQLLVVEKAKH